MHDLSVANTERMKITKIRQKTICDVVAVGDDYERLVLDGVDFTAARELVERHNGPDRDPAAPVGQ